GRGHVASSFTRTSGSSPRWGTGLERAAADRAAPHRFIPALGDGTVSPVQITVPLSSGSSPRWGTGHQRILRDVRGLLRFIPALGDGTRPPIVTVCPASGSSPRWGTGRNPGTSRTL